MTVASPAECLRAGCRAQHASIERALRALTSPALTLDGYRRILGALLGFYEPLEAGLSRVAGLPADLDRLGLRGREKTPRLRRDLRTLGASDGDLEALPSCPVLPRVDGVPRALGCMYVLEGATLGGRVVARKLEEHLSIDARSGGDFFHAYGSETGAMWSAFVARLNRQRPPFDDVLAAAVETFERLECWLFARGAPTWQIKPAPRMIRSSI